MRMDLKPAENFCHALVSARNNNPVPHKSMPVRGEHQLLWGMLEDAIRTYLGNVLSSNPFQQQKFREVHTWFHTGHQDNPAALFNYRTVCVQLGINPDQLLSGLESFGLAQAQHHPDQIVHKSVSGSLGA